MNQEPILFGISARKSSLSEEHLKKFASAYSITRNEPKHEIFLAKNLLRKESQLPTLLKQFI